MTSEIVILMNGILMFLLLDSWLSFYVQALPTTLRSSIANSGKLKG